MPAPDYAAEYASGRSRIRSLLATCSLADAATIVPACPDWTVHDTCAHLAGVSRALVLSPTRELALRGVSAFVCLTRRGEIA